MRSKFRNANSDQLWDVLNEEFHRSQERINPQFNVRSIMNTWTRQNSYPIVHCEISGPGRIKLTQKPYPSKHGNASALWWIPITLTDSIRVDFGPSGLLSRLWLSPHRPSVDVKIPSIKDGGWFVLNGQMAGYFRVQYDPANYERLSEQLLTDHSVFPYLTRSQLINDAFSLAMADLLDYEIPLKMSKYLKAVDDKFVREIAVNHLRNMKELSTDPSHVDIFQVRFLFFYSS